MSKARSVLTGSQTAHAMNTSGPATPAQVRVVQQHQSKFYILCRVRRRSMLARGTFHKFTLHAGPNRSLEWTSSYREHRQNTGVICRRDSIARFVPALKASTSYNWKPVHTGAA